MKRDFTKIAFQSSLFKGRSQWYFCFLKSEKLAHVLTLLVEKSVSRATDVLEHTADLAAEITERIAYTAAGEITEETMFASLFSIVSRLRLHASQGYLSRETTQVLVEEYEGLVERLVNESHNSGLAVSSEDLAVPSMVETPLFSTLPSPLGLSSAISVKKDIYKGHTASKGHKDTEESKGQNRPALILDFVKKNKGVSIRDIGKVVQGCSEKTIQRDLNTMISQGVIVRSGERRWSLYYPA